MLLHCVSSSSSASSSRRTAACSEAARPTSVERPGAVHPWVSAQLRNTASSSSPAITGSATAQVQPSHPFIQDPAMPPNPAPNPLTQLEEARRRLEEERRRNAVQQAKQRSVLPTAVLHDRVFTITEPAGIRRCWHLVLFHHLMCFFFFFPPRHKSCKRQVCENMTVAYYFCGEPIPYRTSVKGRVVTLGQFKELLTKKGHYR